MSINFLAFLLLFVFIIQTEAKYGCPKINPRLRCSQWVRCTNTWNSADYNYKVVFNCNGFNGRLADLDEFLKTNLDGYEIDEFIFNNYRLQRLPDGVFENSKIRRISISNSPLLENFGYRGSGKTIFDGLGQSLETLIITNSPNILAEEWNNMVTSLSANSTAPVLRNLILFRQNIKSSTITEFTPFNNLKNLETIIMRAISLTSFIDSPIDLRPFTKLRLLDLSENRLAEFDAKLPPSLSAIYLNANRELKGFGSGFFAQLNSSNVNYINVRDPNKMDCNCERVDEIVGNPVGAIFDGTCATPRQVKGKTYGQNCFLPPYADKSGKDK